MSDYTVFAVGLRKLLAKEELRGEFMSRDTTARVQKELGLSEPMAVEMKNVLMDIEQTTARQSAEASGGVGSNSASRMRTQTLASIDAAQEFLDRSFGQLQTAYRLSLGMSISLFVVGLGFLLIAGIRSFTHPESVGSTAVVAGIGIAQIIALFYRNPLQDVGRSVSNAQQSKMAIMSYMLGVSLVGEDVYHGMPTEGAGRRLDELTHGAIELLERFAEGRTGGSAEPTRNASQHAATDG